MSKPLRGIMFDNTSGDLSNNLGLGDAALTHLTSGADNIAVGYNALQTTTTGSSNVAIGNQAASDSNYSNTITINATGNSLDTTNDSGCFVAPIRNASATNALYYDNTTKEITWDASGGGGGGGGGDNLVSGNLLVTGTIEAKGDLLPPVQSAEGNSNSVITDLDPSTNPLMTKGMLWMNKAQDKIADAEWGYVAPMNHTTRWGLGVAALEGKLYAVGGIEDCDVPGGCYIKTAEVYDPIDNSWNAIAPMDMSRTSMGCATLGGKLYAVGGMTTGPNNLSFLASGEVYDPSENSWNPIASMSAGRACFKLAALGGKLYAVGGNTGSNGVLFASTEVYDPIINSWSSFAQMNVGRGMMGVAALGGKLYVVGGRLNGGGFATATVGVFGSVHLGAGATWSYIAPLNIGRYYPSAAAFGGKLYAIGGTSYDATTNTTHVQDTVEVYDPMNPSEGWHVAWPSMNTTRSGFGVAALGGKLYVAGGGGSGAAAFGGGNVSGVNQTVEAYTIHETLETFSSLPTAPSTFYAPWSTATMGKVFVGGGTDAAGQPGSSTNHSMTAYDVSSGLWGPLNSQTNAGRQAACAEALGGKIYLFGGWYDGDTPADPDFGATAICCDYTTDTWTPIASMNASHTYFGSAVLGGKIYAIGSWYAYGDAGSRTVEAYDPSTNSWTNVAPMDASRGGMKCVTLLGKIYAPGGGVAGANGGVGYTASVEVYDPATGTWSYIAPLSGGRWAAQTLAVRGKLYVVGGGNVAQTTAAATEVYDPMNPTQGWTTLSDTHGLWWAGGATSMGNIYVIGGQTSVGTGMVVQDGLHVSVFSDDESKWNYVAPMDTSRNGAVCVALGGKLYIAGGVTGVTSLSSAAVYDPNTNSWETIHTMNSARSAAAGAALGGKLYVVGGGRKTAEVYDPINDSWNYIASMDVSRGWFGCAALGGKLYAVGGDDNIGYGGLIFDTVECYDPIDNSWNYIASLNTARDTRAVALGGKLYAVGGAIWDSQRVPTNIVEVYDPMNPSDGWSYSVPMDISRQLLGCAAIGGLLYAAGGIIGTPNNAPGAIVNSVEVYDPMNPSGGWSYSVPMNISRAYFQCAALGGKLYAAGGMWFEIGGASPDFNSVEAYTPPASMTPQITYQGEDFYISHSRGGPKTFVIPHPEHEGKMLRHACLEAPTRGTNVYEYQITTTEDNQITAISLPSYFKHINGSPNVFVSPKNVLSTCYGNVNDDLTAALITTEKPGTFNVMVTGVRKDPDAVAYSATECIDEPIAVEDIH